MAADIIIGIDLGTTNSCVAAYGPDGPWVLPNRTGQHTTPSVVAVTEEGKRLVGHLAKRQAITNPANTVYGAKRLVGRGFDSSDAKRAAKMVPFKCLAAENGSVCVRLAGKDYAPAEVSSMVLLELRRVAEHELGQPVTKAVITVPAYFNDHQRQATRDAAKIAGLEVVRMINEPTAAALAFGYGRSTGGTLAIYDLGGGTFDTSILLVGQGVYEVLATAGDTFLGGEDFDECIIDWLAKEFLAENDIDLRLDRMALQRLRDAAENAKMELSALSEVDINLPFIFSSHGHALHLERKLTREKFGELVRPLVERSIEICGRVLERAKISKDEIAAVVLVGGMTRVPLVQEAVANFFGVSPSKNVHPDEAVALGAAIQGHILSTPSDETLLLDVTPHDLGIMVHGGAFDSLISANTTIPTHANKVFTTIRDNQERVRIIVLQGDSGRSETELLGEFLLEGLPPAPAGQVRIDVTFEISADGIVGVSARDLATGKEQAITVSASSGLNKAQIASMAAENEDVLVKSEAHDEREELRVELERSLRLADELLPDVRDLFSRSEYGIIAISKADMAIQAARYAVGQDKVQVMLEAKRDLNRTVRLLAELQRREKIEEVS